MVDGDLISHDTLQRYCEENLPPAVFRVVRPVFR